jgi:PLP dependent protein
MSIAQNIADIQKQLPAHVKLVAVSKTKSVDLIQEAFDSGQKLFGENYVQEVTDKQPQLPREISWHFIGHLQSNKVKFIAPFVDWIHAVESEKLLAEINKQAKKHNRVIHCLLQMHIAQEESKFGFDEKELLSFCEKFIATDYPHIEICGLMGMASFTEDTSVVRSEFKKLKQMFDHLKQAYFGDGAYFSEISMGMSGDWQMAVEEGSTMVRIGSAIFGSRT